MQNGMNSSNLKSRKRTVLVDNKTRNAIRKYVWMYSNQNKFVNPITCEEIVLAQRDMKARLNKK